MKTFNQFCQEATDDCTHAQQLIQRALDQYEKALEELYRSFPHGRPPTGLDQGWLDRYNQVVEARKLAEAAALNRDKYCKN